MCILVYRFVAREPGGIPLSGVCPVLKQYSVRVCVCVFIKLHITAQSGPVILVILCHSCVCVFIKLHITAQSGLVIPVILCHSR